MATSNLEKTGIKILKAMPNVIRKPAVYYGTELRKLKMKRLKTPINITLYATDRCNAKCKHCFYTANLNKKNPELNLEQIKKIAKSLKHKLRTLMISGGEPSLREDIPELCKIFTTYNQTRRVTIDTNGMLTKKITKMTKRILQENPETTIHIQLSLDGPEKIHDRIRGVKGCYKKAKATLRELEKNNQKNLEISALTTICDLNFDVTEKFSKEFSKEHPKVLHKFNIMRGAHIGTYGLSETITSNLDPAIALTKKPEDLRKLFEKINKNPIKNKDRAWQNLQKLKWKYTVDMLEKQQKIVNCTAQYTFAVIYANGDVAICEPMKPIGNLNETDYNFHKLWNSNKAKKFKKATNNCFCIHPCNLLDSMSYDARTIAKI